MEYLTHTEQTWSEFSRPFSAKYAGTCAASGLPFWAGEQIRVSPEAGRLRWGHAWRPR